jgi:hypothetical protein
MSMEATAWYSTWKQQGTCDKSFAQSLIRRRRYQSLLLVARKRVALDVTEDLLSLQITEERCLL